MTVEKIDEEKANQTRKGTESQTDRRSTSESSLFTIQVPNSPDFDETTEPNKPFSEPNVGIQSPLS